NPRDLLRFLQAKLPGYMVPSVVKLLDALPLTPSGKVDRRALPSPDLKSPAELDEVLPREPLETALAAIWCEVLGLRSVGVHDDFFQLGGHSLSAIQLTSRAGAVFQVAIPMRSVFECPTIARLAARIADLRRAPGYRPPARPLRVERSRDDPLPLSSAQQRLWFLQQLDGRLVAYNLTDGLQLRGPLDVESLRRALETIVERHEPLRT